MAGLGWMVCIVGASITWVGIASAEDEPTCMMRCVEANETCSAACPSGTEAGSDGCLTRCQERYEECVERCEPDQPVDPT